MLAVVTTGATLSGTVKDTSGTSLPGVAVAIMPFGGGGATLRDTTDASGLFSISDVANGFYQIQASRIAYNTTVEMVQMQSGDMVRNITLTPQGAGGSIGGAVMDSASGTAIGGALVRIQQPGTSGTATMVDSTVTDSGGRYRFDGVQVGFYVVQVAAAGYAARTVQANFSGTGTMTLNLRLARKASAVGNAGAVRSTPISTGTVQGLVRQNHVVLHVVNGFSGLNGRKLRVP